MSIANPMSTIPKAARLSDSLISFACCRCGGGLAPSLAHLDTLLAESFVRTGKGAFLAHAAPAACRASGVPLPAGPEAAEALRREVKAHNAACFLHYGVRLNPIGPPYDPTADTSPASGLSPSPSAAPFSPSPAPAPSSAKGTIPPKVKSGVRPITAADCAPPPLSPRPAAATPRPPASASAPISTSPATVAPPSAPAPTTVTLPLADILTMVRDGTVIVTTLEVHLRGSLAVLLRAR